MSRILLFSAIVLAAAMIGDHASAQAVVSYPEVCAQFYPNANCQNLGPGNPYTGDYQRSQMQRGQGSVAQDSPVSPRRDRHRRHRNPARSAGVQP